MLNRLPMSQTYIYLEKISNLFLVIVMSTLGWDRLFTLEEQLGEEENDVMLVNLWIKEVLILEMDHVTSSTIYIYEWGSTYLLRMASNCRSL